MSRPSRTAWLLGGSLFSVAAIGFGTLNLVDLLAHDQSHVHLEFAGAVQVARRRQRRRHHPHRRHRRRHRHDRRRRSATACAAGTTTSSSKVTGSSYGPPARTS